MKLRYRPQRNLGKERKMRINNMPNYYIRKWATHL